jgi:hypothetical protein
MMMRMVTTRRRRCRACLRGATVQFQPASDDVATAAYKGCTESEIQFFCFAYSSVESALRR